MPPIIDRTPTKRLWCCARLPLLVVPLAFGLAACAEPPAPRDTFYRLETAPAAHRFARPPLPGILEVDRVEAEGVLGDRAIAYLSAPGAVRRYSYEFWADPPGRMVQDALVRALRAANAAGTVVTPDLRLVPTWIVRARLLRFEQEPAAGRVAVALRVAVLGADDSHLVMQRDYAVEAPATGTSPAAAAAAMGRAMSEVLSRMVADLGRPSR